VTYVYGIGLLKDDSATGQNLAGAKFRIYKDKECTIPVYVIPTNIKGIYIVDSKGTPSETVTGSHMLDARETYAEYLDDYLADGVEQDNYVVSQVNGKLAILGLKAGTYYLLEVEAPAGYNALTVPIEITAGEGTRPFNVFADEDGNVADIQQPDSTHTEKVYNLTHTVVHNSKGVELPSTGGEGTFWMITIGTLLTIGFAVFLITHKKMSIYTD
jgi:LPXTG-motif cell wall-anchored protein